MPVVDLSMRVCPMSVRRIIKHGTAIPRFRARLDIGLAQVELGAHKFPEECVTLDTRNLGMFE